MSVLVTKDGVEESLIETLSAQKRRGDFGRLFSKEEALLQQEAATVIKDEICWGWMHFDDAHQEQAEEITVEEVTA